MDQVPTTADTADANDIYANPPDPDVLELEPVHPGINDAAYVARRHELFALCRRYRLGNLGPPLIDYTAEEQRIWREVSPKLDELHVRHASRIYLDAKRALGISATEIPQLRHLSEQLKARTGMHLVPAEGPIAYRIFYTYIADGGFPCTQFMRYGSQPEYTPEPDMVHDCLGHVPPLVNHDYAALLADDRARGRARLVGRPRPGAEAFQLVLDRVRPDRGSRGATRLRRRHPVVDRRDPVLAVGERRASAVRHRRGDRDRLRLDEDAGTPLRDPVVRVPARRGRAPRPPPEHRRRQASGPLPLLLRRRRGRSGGRNDGRQIAAHDLALELPLPGVLPHDPEHLAPIVPRGDCRPAPGSSR